MIYSWDTEANGSLQDATKLHVLSYKMLGHDVISETRNFDNLFADGDTWICHNQFGYDLPLLQKFGVINDFTTETVTLPYGEVRNVQFIDTLALSREWYPDLERGHGLKPWSIELGTYKPEIDDWENLPIEEYVRRCEEDVITTEKLFLHLAEKLGVEYEA